MLIPIVQVCFCFCVRVFGLDSKPVVVFVLWLLLVRCAAVLLVASRV